MTGKRVYDRHRRDFDWPLASRISYVLWRRTSWTGGFAARAHAFWHHVVRGYAYEICGECGRPVEQVWLADDPLWLEVMGHEGGLLCIPCFDAELEERGLFVRWKPIVKGRRRGPQTAPPVAGY